MLRNSPNVPMAKNVVGTRGISDDTVKEKTGRSWKEWFSILDKQNVRLLGHTRTAKFLHEQEKVSPWWAQAITSRYEDEKGLRK